MAVNINLHARMFIWIFQFALIHAGLAVGMRSYSSLFGLDEFHHVPQKGSVRRHLCPHGDL